MQVAAGSLLPRRNTARTRASSSAKENGLTTKSSAPRLSVRIRSSSESRPEHTITGTALWRRILARTSVPSKPGRPRSRITRLVECWNTARSADGPSGASITRYPLRSKYWWSALRQLWSSSATTMVFSARPSSPGEAPQPGAASAVRAWRWCAGVRAATSRGGFISRSFSAGSSRTVLSRLSDACSECRPSPAQP